VTGRTYRFTWVDVFSRQAFQGNQLAVFTDAQGLSDSEMQSLARETGLSETTFVFPRDQAIEENKGVRTRLFTIAEELDFAGHPVLGTATVLATSGRLSEIALDLNSGRVPVRFDSWEENSVYAEMTQREPWIGKVHPPEEVAKVLGVVPRDFDPELPIQTISTGNSFMIVPFRSLDLLSRLNPDIQRMQHYLQTTDAKLFYLVCRETVDPKAKLHARMIFPGSEDPATGSAAGPAAAWMALHGILEPEEAAIIEQGLEVRRSSEIHVRAGLAEGKPTNIRVGGHVVTVMRGEVTL
jgi:trans-2,3-dihydro-3-hydroxyanthranilate isomerase